MIRSRAALFRHPTQTTQSLYKVNDILVTKGNVSHCGCSYVRIIERKDIPIHIIDNESYEKDVVFYVELGDPKLEEDLIKEGIGQKLNDDTEKTELSEAEKIAMMGKPRIGEQYRCTVRIKESKEFKNTVDKLFQKANASLTFGTSTWKEQFVEAVTVGTGDDDEEGEENDDDEDQKLPSSGDYVMHFFTIFWKVLFAFVPPADYMDGWLCFVTSICIIGILTAFIGDLASHFGCTLEIKDQVTAIAFVALGNECSRPQRNKGFM
ncbi:sodium/calcium exchanger 2-like [Tachypleus tridentatus]|uniref:sodium/calcium exchanger 2-like n=1 Tax=Tachypleus tridentatus TaxID=6853 RepID=UPI003FD5D7B2